MTNYTWKKGLFDCSYKLYSNHQEIGFLRDRAFSKCCKGEINGKQYSFRTSGFLRQNTQIFDENNLLIGDVQYSNWLTKASINLGNRKIHWQFDNVWNSKWSMNDSTGLQIHSSFSTCKGNIDSNSLNDQLLLIGLFVSIYYKQMTIIILIAAFVPLWITLLN